MSTASLLNSNFDDSDDEEDFNPQQADVSDDEETSAPVRKEARREPSEDASDKESAQERASSKKISPQDDEDEDEENADDDEDAEGAGEDTGRRAQDDDEEDEEDEEDDEEEEISGRPRKRRREGRNQFLDVEAEVDEDEDENEDDEDELNEIKDNFIADTHPDDLAALPAGEENDDRRHRELDRRREMEASLDAEKQAEILRQRYATKKGSGRGLGDASVVPKRLLLPSIDDPSIWAIRCKEGKEKEAIFSIMKRVEERTGTKQELQITSAFERGGVGSVMKGYIYVEAMRQADVLTALDGVMNVYPRTKMLLVNIKEMPDLFRIQKAATLIPGAYVRLKRPPKYAGDLAQVTEVGNTGLEIRIRFVPRLDYGAYDDVGTDAFGKRKRTAGGPRPPLRLFNEAEAKKRHAKYLQARPDKSWLYQGDEYINGFCEKEVKLQHLEQKDVNPTLEEVTRFASGQEDGSENLDLNALAASLRQSSANASYQPGDIIEVYEGEQKGIIGKAVSVRGDIVTMSVFDGLLAGQTIEIPTKGLRKRFQEGDHVKVIGGSRFRDEVGMVVKIVEDRVTFLSDQGNNEITVFSKDLREASDSGGGGTLGQFELWDLVQLDPSTVGCIIKVDRESLGVLDQNNQKRTVMPSQISNKLERRKDAVATDRNGGEIRVDDGVKEFGGEARSGKIIHIHRAYLFIRNPQQHENAGVFVTRTTSVQTVSAKGGRLTTTTAALDLSSMNPALKINRPEAAMPPPKSFGRDRAIGQTVTIRKGPYKGLLGIVKETTDTHARVELHTKSKTINVPKDTLGFKDKISGQSIDPNARGGFGGSRGGMSSRGGGRGGPTPGGWEGGRTPASSGLTERTPAWGSRTPAPNAGGRTPGWKTGGDGGRTPAWAANDGSRTSNPYDGSRTAYGAGNRTPAWSAGAKTPAYGMSSAFDSGSKTPGYAGTTANDSWGAKTPAYQPPQPPAAQDTWSNQAPSNGWQNPPQQQQSNPYDAPTPAPYSAPTPGAANAPTPAPYQNTWSAPTPAPMDAQTPAFYSAPTPGAYGGMPETPAANWQDDGPRYVD